ncbi:peptide/nickel transport system substrate-binding protein [Haloactinopolyspora alba]|uniref:Peptide/nickel transport system substrate-binding protein n=1 Tax=Haloactinopolyspora alba TaxID=648780 RepID=A0A2P8DZS2_9ACTN|nr:ABC transporter substrate-binding protein [Haloactinopolyspora alba]PSL02714.1 peptide/nickel transport system substrate-binding protein [Haloactinopolyspora alba]
MTDHRPLFLPNRRTFLAGVGAAGLAAVVGCSADGDSPSRSDKGPEAPGLADLVDSGELPPVEDRLPAKPLVVEPVERVGVYGGRLNTVVLGQQDLSYTKMTIGYEGLMRWTPDWSDTIPNVAESVDVSDDASTYTFHLREGMRWSDGKPFTAADIVFAANDVAFNEEFAGAVESAHLSNPDGDATAEALDEYTVRITFPSPNAGFLDELSTFNSAGVLVGHPKHYMSQFHPAHNDKAQANASAAGFEHWVDYYVDRADWRINTELPTVNGWVVTRTLEEGSEILAERNPYYWKVDPDGSQLPYLDEIRHELVSDEEVVLLKATQGELDIVTRHINSLENKPVLADAREDGDYHFIDLQTSFMNEMVISLNLNHQNQVKREIFQNKDFRIALSHAINRDEMNNAVFQAQGEAWQAAPNPDSIYYDEEMAQQYTEYDEDLANQMLDEAGYAERDSDGYRVGPDGERIRITVEIASPAPTPYMVDAMELVSGYWDAVGIDTRPEPIDRSLYQERTAANEHDAGVWNGTGGFRDEVLAPLYYLPSRTALVAWAVEWAEYFISRGAEGETPPQAPLRQMELFWQMESEPDQARREELFREILQIAKDEFYTIGTLRIPLSYGTVANSLKNVPEAFPTAFRFADPAPTNLSQYFFED